MTLEPMPASTGGGWAFLLSRGLISLAETVVRPRRAVALAAEDGAAVSMLAVTPSGHNRRAPVRAQDAVGAARTIGTAAVEAARP